MRVSASIVALKDASVRKAVLQFEWKVTIQNIPDKALRFGQCIRTQRTVFKEESVLIKRYLHGFGGSEFGHASLRHDTHRSFAGQRVEVCDGGAHPFHVKVYLFHFRAQR